MTATITVQECNGAVAGVWTDVTTVYFKTKDECAADTAYPTPIPAASFNFSYWKSIRLKITGAYTKISAIKIYTDGSIGFPLGTAADVYIGKRNAGDNGCPTGSYQQALGTEGTTGKDMTDGTDGHAYYKGQSPAVALLDAYSAASPLDLDGAEYTTTPGPEYTKHVVLQWKVAPTATPGLVTPETITFQYNEI